MKDYVLIISIHADPALPPGYNEWGGTHTYMRELLIEFCNCGIPCILVTRKTMAELPDVEFYSETCVVYRIVSDSPKAINKTKLRYLHDIHLEQIKGIIRAQESIPRIIHSVYWNSGRLALELSKQNGIPFVHSVISNSRGRVYRGAYEPIQERADFEQQIYDSATWVICVSEDEANDLSVFYNVPHDKIVVAGQYIHGFLSRVIFTVISILDIDCSHGSSCIQNCHNASQILRSKRLFHLEQYVHGIVRQRR